MGHRGSKAAVLEGVQERVAARTGKIQITGRYHRLPKHLEDDYVIESKVLGTGYNSHENGPVKLARGKSDDCKYAVKRFKIHGLSTEKQQELQSEVEIFLTLDHPHVARLCDAYESEDYLSLVMECMEGGELFDRVKEVQIFSERDAAEASHQMLLAISYLHSHEVVHRDLKLENFLYERKGADHLKLIDFGFSKIWAEKSTRMELSCGTLSYVAPEVLGKSYTSQCDLWSFGVVVFILLSGYMPFSGEEEIQTRHIKMGKFKWRPERWTNVSKAGKNFVARLLVVNPEERMTAQDAMEHAWITGRATHPEREAAVDLEIVNSLQSFAHQSQFRRACMSMMAWSLSVEERQKVRDIFLDIDTSNTGVITFCDLKRVLESEFHLPNDEVRAIFAAMDTNHDDTIHYNDFLAAMCHSRVKVHDDLIYQAFRRFDVDNSGKISQESLRLVLGESFEGETVEQIMAEVPHEGGDIDYKAFLEYLLHPDADESHHRMAASVVDSEMKKMDVEGHLAADKYQREALTARTKALDVAEEPASQAELELAGTKSEPVKPSKQGSAKPDTPKKGAKSCAVM